MLSPRSAFKLPPYLTRSNRSLISSARTFLDYADTIPNLKIGSGTRVIYQGFTGRLSTINAQQSIVYGTQVVGGTTPGKEGEHLGLPLLPSVEKAAKQLKPDATAVFVAAYQAGKAIEDAIAAEIPLIVAVAEFIPLHDILRISSILKTQSISRLVGANSPGIISPLGKCRIGFQPLPCYTPGHIGLITKSGTLSYETVGALTRAELGQSLCIGMGGDIVSGTNLVEALSLFENDDDTEAIILVGEVGGRAEQDAAEWILDYKRRSPNPKPIVALVAGLKAPAGRIMGHAGAFASIGEDPANVKHDALKAAGVPMVSHPTEFPELLKRVFVGSKRDISKLSVNDGETGQRRGYHTMKQRPRLRSTQTNSCIVPQRRALHLDGTIAKQILKDAGVATSEEQAQHEPDKRFLAITVDRTNRCPAIVASPTAKSDQIHVRSKHFLYDLQTGPSDDVIRAIFEQLQMSAAPSAVVAALGRLVRTMANVFKSKEAYAMTTILSPSPDGGLKVEQAQINIDDSAYRSGKRQIDLSSLRDTAQEDPDEVEAENNGIVYVKLTDPEARTGTLINGAGLAMNAIDALTELGARPTNFLDTGGKATTGTIKKSFELLLRDRRVKVIFVNIFGGLTLCDMIAEGIMLAFKDLRMKVPVVVRLRGTNEAKGQQMIAESGLPLHAFDSFQEAAQKCIELAARA